MAKKRKYINFILECTDEIFNSGENFFESHDWRDVFASYMKRESATVYGLPVDWEVNPYGNYEVILSK